MNKNLELEEGKIEIVASEHIPVEQHLHLLKQTSLQVEQGESFHKEQGSDHHCLDKWAGELWP